MKAARAPSALRQSFKRKKSALDERFGHISFFAQFAIVGASGTVVNLLMVSLFHGLWDYTPEVAIAAGILVSMTSNFFLNRWITFSYARDRHWFSQFIKYAVASSVGIFVNYLTALKCLSAFPEFQAWPQIPAAIGVLAGMMFNFFMSRFWVFKKH